MPIRPSVKAIESNLLYIDEGGNLVLDTIGKLLGQIQSGVIPQFLVRGGPTPVGALTLTDGTHTVADVDQITVSGATVGGTTPNATLAISGGGGSSVGPLGFGATLDMSGVTSILDNTNGDLTVSPFTSINVSSSASITRLNVSGATIAALVCNDDSVLASINASGATALTTVTCHDDAVLSDIDVSGCTSLATLDLQSTSISSLDLTSNTSLTNLTCDDSLLSSLAITGLTSLAQLTCLEHSLVGINISTNTSLTAVAIYEGPLASIDLSNNIELEILTLDENALSTLNIAANTALTQVSAIANSLSVSAVNGILSDLDTNGLSNGVVDISGGTNAAPTVGPPNGIAAKASLIGKGWSVTTN